MPLATTLQPIQISSLGWKAFSDNSEAANMSSSQNHAPQK
jgi:hypothetical protein